MPDSLPSATGAPAPRSDPHGFATLGALTHVAPHTSSVTLSFSEARLRLDALSDNVLRLRLAPPRGAIAPDDASYAPDPAAEWNGPSDFTVAENEYAVTISTASLTVTVRRDAGRLRITDAAGRVVMEDAGGVAWAHAEHAPPASTVAHSLRLDPSDRLLGLGDKPLALDRRGHILEMWNTDAFRYQRGTDPLYKSIPVVLLLREATAAGLFYDSTHRTRFDLGASNVETMRMESEGGALDLYVMAGPSPLDVLRRLARLTGHTPMLPKWALGYHQCRYSYRDEGEIREVTRELRERRIPCDVIYFDIHYMDGYRVFTWDRDAFPDPAALIGDLQDDGFQSVVIIDPGVKADDPEYRIAQEGLKRDAFVRYPDGSHATGEVWPGLCYFPDYTREEVRRWWGGLHAGLVEIGVAGIWNDMNEPALFNVNRTAGQNAEEDAGTLPDEARHDFEGRGASHAAMHNVYGMQMLRSTYEGLAELHPERRPFTITRAAYAGTQRFGTAWTGDNTASWDHLRLALQQCLSLGVCGMPFTGADVGGFIEEPTPELMARWTQVGALMPLFRNHSAVDTPRQEPWLFGEDVERVCREAIELRMRLLPVLYTALHEAATDGLPIIRPLPLIHPHDETIRRTSPLGFYVGATLLAHPVLEKGQTSRDVYLPASAGGWMDLHTGDFYDGRQTVWIDTPLDRIPLYVKAGHVLHLAPVTQHTGAATDEPHELHVVLAPGHHTTHLYDDSGDGWAFQDGICWDAIATLHVDETSARLSWSVTGSYAPAWTCVAVVHGLRAEPPAVTVNGLPVLAHWSGSTLHVPMAPGDTLEIERSPRPERKKDD